MRDDPYMTKPTHILNVAEVVGMPESQWLNLVSELAFPQRQSCMRKAMSLAQGSQNIVETGCIRGWAGDGQSTLILAMLAARRDGHVNTFDTSADHIQKAKSWLGPFVDYVTWHHMDSVEGLSKHTHPVDFVYLDSYDYNALNPRPCQLHQLAEVGAIYGKLTEKAIIMMDDAQLEGGGKVAMSLDFLKERGWKQVVNDYQIVLCRNGVI